MGIDRHADTISMVVLHCTKLTQTIRMVFIEYGRKALLAQPRAS
jgi:hypothetical protein